MITPSAFDVLSARAEITDEIMTDAQVDFAMGQCVADGVITGVGPAGYGELTASSLSADQETQIGQLAASSMASCQA